MEEEKAGAAGWAFCNSFNGFLLASGVKPILMQSVKSPGGDTVKTAKSSLVLYHDEASLRARRKRDRGHVVFNAERIYIFTAEDAPALPYKDRVNNPGTTRGEILGPLQAPAWDDPCIMSQRASGALGSLE